MAARFLRSLLGTRPVSSVATSPAAGRASPYVTEERQRPARGRADERASRGLRETVLVDDDNEIDADAAFRHVMAASAQRILAGEEKPYDVGLGIMGELLPLLKDASYAGAAYYMWGFLTDGVDGAAILCTRSIRMADRGTGAPGRRRVASAGSNLRGHATLLRSLARLARLPRHVIAPLTAGGAGTSGPVAAVPFGTETEIGSSQITVDVIS
jgi:hypothetical protein